MQAVPAAHSHVLHAIAGVSHHLREQRRRCCPPVGFSAQCVPPQIAVCVCLLEWCGDQEGGCQGCVQHLLASQVLGASAGCKCWVLVMSGVLQEGRYLHHSPCGQASRPLRVACTCVEYCQTAVSCGTIRSHCQVCHGSHFSACMCMGPGRALVRCSHHVVCTVAAAQVALICDVCNTRAHLHLALAATLPLLCDRSGDHLWSQLGRGYPGPSW